MAGCSFLKTPTAPLMRTVLPVSTPRDRVESSHWIELDSPKLIVDAIHSIGAAASTVVLDLEIAAPDHGCSEPATTTLKRAR
jgi:hypothetical protein